MTAYVSECVSSNSLMFPVLVLFPLVKYCTSLAALYVLTEGYMTLVRKLQHGALNDDSDLR